MRIHIIQTGDTFWEVAEQYPCSIDDLMSCNPDLKPKAFVVGEKLYVPELNDGYLIFFCLFIQFIINWITDPLSSLINPSLPRLSSTHRIKKDETIISLSQYYDCSEEDIKSINPRLNTELLKVGDEINVPKMRRKSVISSSLYRCLPDYFILVRQIIIGCIANRHNSIR
jgi:spore germination protein